MEIVEYICKACNSINPCRFTVRDSPIYGRDPEPFTCPYNCSNVKWVLNKETKVII